MGNPIEGVDYFVHIVPFPVDAGCDGAVTPNPDGTYSVYLDARTTFERRIRAVRHEIDHISCDDFYNERCIKDVEGF